MERMRARRAAMKVKGLASQWACAAYSSHASRWACALWTACTSLGYHAHHTALARLPFSQAVVRTTPPIAIKTKTNGVMWMVNRILDLLEFKKQASQCFAGNQRCRGVWNSFPFLAWDLTMHPRTQICFFNKFICTWACACSSNFNYAPIMHWKLS